MIHPAAAPFGAAITPRDASMSHFYHVYFSQALADGRVADGDATLVLDQNLDYVSDVAKIKQLLAQQYPGVGVVVKSWQPLKGPERPPQGIKADAPAKLQFSPEL